MLRAASRILRNPRHLFGHRNIFLFSHMRANTSLFGHILGSHPDIEGYYEMHIGYYSWKSLWRQKFLYLENHSFKPSSYIFFDKLLHDYCVVSQEILARSSTHSIFMLRSPEKSIKSTVSLYRKNQPEHEYAQVSGATKYYTDRVQKLANIAKTMRRQYYYLDAEDLIKHPVETLASLSAWLNLSQPLVPEYQTFSKTGTPQAGDNSELIKSGTINQRQHDYSHINLDAAALAAAEAIYLESRNSLIIGSAVGPAVPDVSVNVSE